MSSRALFFNQAVIQMLERIQICFPEEKPAFAYSTHTLREGVGFWPLPVPAGPALLHEVCERDGSHPCLPQTCLPVQRVPSQTHWLYTALLKPPFLPLTISSCFSTSFLFCKGHGSFTSEQASLLLSLPGSTRPSRSPGDPLTGSLTRSSADVPPAPPMC